MGTMSDDVNTTHSTGNGSYKPSSVGDTEVYYHALYHHIAHWAAYIAMMAILISIGSNLSVFQGASAPFRRAGAIGVTIIAWAGAWYFIRGMDTYGAILCEAVPKSYLDRTQTNPHSRTITIGKVAATVAALMDLALILAIAMR